MVEWEIALKASLGTIDVPGPVTAALVAGGARELPVSAAHARRIADLPWHHRDPFDRLLAAQALEEDAVLLSADLAVDAYGVRRRW